MTQLPAIHCQPSAPTLPAGRVTPLRPTRRSHRPPAGSVSTLTAESRPEVLAHLLRLSEDDLRLRFLRCMPTASIETHVASLDFDSAIRLGMRRHGRLVAMVEGFVYGDHGDTVMEVAFSTDPAWRGRGLARSLGDAIADIAAHRGVARIVARCDARNGPMKSLLRALGAAIEHEDSELSATWVPPRRPEDIEAVFEHVVCPTEEQTARRLFATLPLGEAYAQRLVQALATGMLVATAESACIAEMQRHLADGETVVGTEVDVRHVGPALPGHRLCIRGRGQWLEHRRRATFVVTLDDDCGPVATARVVLAVVCAARFAAGVARRHEAASLLAA